MAAIKTAKTYVQIGLGLEAFKEPYPVEDIPFMLMLHNTFNVTY